MTGNDVTVVTLTIPGREQLLARCIASVYAQTVKPYAHIILAESSRKDVGKMYNEAVKAVKTEWIHFLDDDNYLLPLHIEKLLSEMQHGVDVVYSWELSKSRPRINFNDWSEDGICNYQDGQNAIDNSCAIRTSTFLTSGGFDEITKTPKDWVLFTKLAHMGAKFRCIPEDTWFYQQVEHDGKMWDAHELRSRGIQPEGFAV